MPSKAGFKKRHLNLPNFEYRSTKNPILRIAAPVLSSKYLIIKKQTQGTTVAR